MVGLNIFIHIWDIVEKINLNFVKKIVVIKTKIIIRHVNGMSLLTF